MCCVVPEDAQAPHRCNVVFSRVSIIKDDNARIVEKGSNIKEATISRYRDAARREIIGLRDRIELVLRAGESVNAQTVLIFGLRDHLIYELPGWTQKNVPLTVLSTEPFSDEQPNQRLAAASGQLHCDVTRGQSASHVLLHCLTLVEQHPG